MNRITAESLFRRDGALALCDTVATSNTLPKTCSRLLLLSAIGGVAYGATMGLNHSWEMACVAGAKVVLLFLLTLLVTLPSLHFIGLLFGVEVDFLQTTTLLLAGVALTNVLLGAFAPISLFFLISGSSYTFLLALHVTIFTICGAAGLAAVSRNMRILLEKSSDKSGKPTGMILRIWFLLYMFIGAQTSYLLTPFLSTPSGEFEWLTLGEGDFFSHLIKTLLSGQN